MKYTNILLAALISSPAAADEPGHLFEVLSQASTVPGTPAASEHSGVLYPAAIRDISSILVNVPGNFKTFNRTWSELRSNGAFLWVGKHSTYDEMLITSDGVHVHARISGPAGLWTVQPVAGGHRIVEIDLSVPIPPDGVEDPASGIGKIDSAPTVAAPLEPKVADGVSIIDFMVLYTSQARDAAGGDAQIRNFAQHLVDVSNQAFETSLVDNVRYRLRHVSLSSVADNGNSVAMLFAIRGHQGIGALRNSYGADSVILLNEQYSDYSAGRAFIQRDVGPLFEQSAYGVVSRYWSQWGAPIFPHEAGHLLGMEHNPGADSAPPEHASFPWSFGHHTPYLANPTPDPGFYTIMSYYGNCGTPCTQLSIFSNPSIILEEPYAGLAAGIAEQRDNARTARVIGPGNSLFRPENDTIFVAPMDYAL